MEKLKDVGKLCYCAVNNKASQQMFIHDVLYVPNLAHHLSSVGQLIQRWYQVNFKGKECKTFDTKSNSLMAKMEMTTNKVFPHSFLYCKDMALKAKLDESHLWLWDMATWNKKGWIRYKKKMLIGLAKI